MCVAGDSRLQILRKFVISGSYVMLPVAIITLRYVTPEALSATHRAMLGSVAIPNRWDDYGDRASGIRRL